MLTLRLKLTIIFITDQSANHLINVSLSVKCQKTVKNADSVIDSFTARFTYYDKENNPINI